MLFNERMALLLKRRRMTAAELSRISGVPKTTVYGMLQGRIKAGNVTVSNFIAIAHALGITADEFYTGEPFRASMIERRYGSLDPSGRALVDIALEAAEARQIEKDAVAGIVPGA